MEEITLLTIDRAAERFAGAHTELASRLAAYHAAVQALAEASLPDIRRALKGRSAARDRLADQVASAPHLFTSPRTLALHGITVGWRKGSGSLEIRDPKKTVQRIKRLLKSRAKDLIKTVETPIKRALSKLDAATLKRLGCHIVGAVDEMVIEPAPSDVETLCKRYAIEAESTTETVDATGAVQ